MLHFYNRCTIPKVKVVLMYDTKKIQEYYMTSPTKTKRLKLISFIQKTTIPCLLEFICHDLLCLIRNLISLRKMS